MILRIILYPLKLQQDTPVTYQDLKLWIKWVSPGKRVMVRYSHRKIGRFLRNS